MSRCNRTRLVLALVAPSLALAGCFDPDPPGFESTTTGPGPATEGATSTGDVSASGSIETDTTTTVDPDSATTAAMTSTGLDSSTSLDASSSSDSGPSFCGDGALDPGEECDDGGEPVAGGSCVDCAIVCNTDYDDCNDDFIDGCEVSLCGGTCDAPGGSIAFDLTGGIESWVVPMCASTITIEAWGAQGGGGPTVDGGLGARMRGDFAVAGGEELQILVGGQGLPATNDSDQGGGSGGGGTFVVDVAGTPWVVAGGGGGALYSLSGVGGYPRELDGGPGQVGTGGQAGDGGGAGGVGGNGGTTWVWSGWHAGTGGGGLLGNGVGASSGSGSYGTPNQPGVAFVNGGAGGPGGSQGRAGGFGGGGAAGFTGGGGGGYSGGGSSTYGDASACSCPGAQTYGGGGGGSYNGGLNQSNDPGVNAGAGRVEIAWQ